MKNSTKVHFMSQRGNWKTPKVLFQALYAEFHFDCDPCPPENRKDQLIYCADMFRKDGLKMEWGKTSYCNPPYGREITQWIAKAYKEAKKGKTVVLLVPSRTDTAWWHDYCMKADEIRFIKGRLHFDDGPTGAPFPSAIVIFRGNGESSDL